MTPVTSSNILAVGWTPARGLRVDFHGGRSYLYLTAPEEIFEAILAAESAGKAFNLLVKQHPNQFPATKVLKETEDDK